MAKKPIKVTEVVLRDAHQSLLATRMTMDEMRPILPEMDKINYFSVECWGGATFDSCIRFLDEDPWERLRILRKELPHQKLQMLFRGQNMLGYRPYADDAVEYFVQKSVANGIDVIRIFDALNDPRNLQTAIKAANKEGAHVQGCISYTLSPVHTNEAFAAYAKTLEEMGADSICIKDMAGLLTPYTCYELVKELKAAVKIPVDIHSHYTAGLASMSILKGIEAGADIVDTAMSPLALGTSHMPTESLVAALRGTDYISNVAPRDRVLAAADAARAPGLTYLYIRDADKIGHTYGWDSDKWIGTFERIDAQLALLRRSVPKGTLIVITADHGMVSSDPQRRIDIAVTPQLARGVAMVGGEPRSVMLYAQEGEDPEDIADRWREFLGDGAQVRTRAQALAEGLFGPVEPRVEPMIGDVLVSAVGSLTMVDSRMQTTQAMQLPSVHGAHTMLEMDIPCLIDLA